MSRREEHLDTDLNIVPIIDCFVMLICFMLFTAAFTQLVFVEAKLTSNTAAAADKSRSEMDQFRIIVTVKDEGFSLSTTGSAVKQKINVSVPNIGDDYDYKSLHQHIIHLKGSNPDRYSADIEVKVKRKERLSYEKILQTIDTIRHLSDDEYGVLRIAQKKIRQVELSDKENEKNVPDHINILAQNLLSNEISKNADQKVLFPDIALLGVE